VSDRVRFTCNGAPVDVDAAPGESLLTVLRERLGLVSVKDGCAPQGQCGCCTVLVDGDARVACVTPVARVADRRVTTVEGLDERVREELAQAFANAGGSQCGFCTPGIVMRAAALMTKGRTGPADVDRALAAHLCRCTGWLTVKEAIADAGTPTRPRDLDAASRRARLEGGNRQRVGVDVPLGDGGFADDLAPRDALVAVPRPPGSPVAVAEAAGIGWVVAESLAEARDLAGKVQGRRTTRDEAPALPLPDRPTGGVRVATGWVEPAYLEPDASWCLPDGEPASPLANGGAFGGKVSSAAPAAARELADRLGRPVRVLLSREDTVRLGPKRPPIAASAVFHDRAVEIDGTLVGDPAWMDAPRSPYALELRHGWHAAGVPGPPTSPALRAFPLAELTLLVEGALAESGTDRGELVADERASGVLLDSCATAVGGATAGARVTIDPTTGAIERVEVRVAAGDPLDDTVLRSYCIGGAHMALGWVLSEGIAVDAQTGDALDLTIRSFGVIRAKDTPPIEVTIVDDPGEPLPRASDAVFASVAAATWNAVTEADGDRPETFPARRSRAARRLRR